LIGGKERLKPIPVIAVSTQKHETLPEEFIGNRWLEIDY
jgi:hypothetical protein